MSSLTFEQILWFAAIALLFAMFLFFSGIDFGVGMATRFVAKSDGERTLYMRAVSPHWNGNEVWLVAAGGTMFAAFPMWYASLFSGYYMLLFLMLVALIVRGVSFEFAGHADAGAERSFWQWANFFGSLLPSFFFGMLLASLIQGVPVDDMGNICANFGDVVNPLSVVGGITLTLLCFVHGLHFLSLKLGKKRSSRMLSVSRKVYWGVDVALVVLVVLAALQTDFLKKRTATTIALLLVIVVAVAAAQLAARAQHGVRAFVCSGVTLLAFTAFVFNGMFPRTIISNDGRHDQVYYHAAASAYTLHAMAIVLCILLPIVLIYFAWSYFIQRKRIES